MNIALLKQKHFVFPSFLVIIAKEFSLSLNDFLLLTYFWNNHETIFDVGKVKQCLSLTENEILVSFNTLMSKKLIKLTSAKDESGKREEVVHLDYLYQLIDEKFQEQKKEETKKDIYTTFESEFGRPISSMEYEIINAWTQKGFTEELILGALKEAVYNGVNNLRYIDKILYEWQRKGYKTMKEVKEHNFNRKEIKKESSTVELFDYNWLDDNA